MWLLPDVKLPPPVTLALWFRPLEPALPIVGVARNAVEGTSLKEQFTTNNKIW